MEIQITDIQSTKIQILRAIAIFCVVMIHCLPGGFIDVPIRVFLNFAVALFVFLSGILTNLEISERKLFYKKRIFRVIIPYIIWTLIYTSVYYFYGTYKDDNLISKITYNLLTAKASGPLYFIFVYVQLVLITPFIKKLAVSKYNWIGFIIPIISIFFILYLPTIIFKIHLWDFYLYPFVLWFSYYYWGICLGSKICDDNVKNINFLLILFFILQFFEGIMWYILGAKGLALTQLKITTNITNIYFLTLCYRFIFNEKLINLKNKIINILVLIGNYSFGIFITHMLIIDILNLLIDKKYQIFPFYSCLVFIVTFIFVYFTGKLVGKKISKWLGFI